MQLFYQKSIFVVVMFVEEFRQFILNTLLLGRNSVILGDF